MPATNADFGPLAERPNPSPSNKGLFWVDTDTNDVYVSTGKGGVWILIEPGAGPAGADPTVPNNWTADQTLVGARWIDTVDPTAADHLSRMGYVDAQDAATLSSANTYADGVAATAESNANTYTDTQIGAQDFSGHAMLADNETVTGTWDFDNTVTFGGDANLYRAAADTLKTDDALIVAGAAVLANEDSAFGFVRQDTVGTTAAYQSARPTDSFPRWFIEVDGRQQWGDGTVAPDTNIARDGVAQLKTNSTLKIESVVGIALQIRDPGSAFPQLEVSGTGIHKWGPGTGAIDTTMSRIGAGLLGVDQSFRVGSDFTVLGNAFLNGSVTIGNAPTDSVSFYGAAGVAQALAIASPSTPGIVYSQAEAQSAVDAINSLRSALQSIGITA